MKKRKILMAGSYIFIVCFILIVIDIKIKKSIINESEQIPIASEEKALTNEEEFLNLEEETPNDEEIYKTSYEELEYANEEILELLREIYNNIDFTSEFKIGNPEKYEFFKKQFIKLINCEKTFINRETTYLDFGGISDNFVLKSRKSFYTAIYSTDGANDPYINQEFYLKDLDLLCNFHNYSKYYDPNKSIYYFFDIDDDSEPELIIANKDFTQYYYVFKYNSANDKFFMWHHRVVSWAYLLGSLKMGYSRQCYYILTQLDKNGNEEMSLDFCVDWMYGHHDEKTGEDDIPFMLGLPLYSDESKNIKINKNMTKYLYKNSYDQLFFRVTEEQWRELTKGFFEARDYADEQSKNLMYTYDEFVNDL